MKPISGFKRFNPHGRSFPEEKMRASFFNPRAGAGGKTPDVADIMMAAIAAVKEQKAAADAVSAAAAVGRRAFPPDLARTDCESLPL